MGKKFFGVIAFVAIAISLPAGTTSKINKVLNCRTWHWRMSRHWQEMKVERTIRHWLKRRMENTVVLL